ncbi:MAG: tRNA uridine-5-carboxymethylaminomethyl(34) synthesis GTPase MnmE [Nitrospinota bacterium]|nr:tRNA uridine-5-carboxymethylaminomethyl(34) synthesis GTPase MnmE [Nitrospinota bacterium]
MRQVNNGQSGPAQQEETIAAISTPMGEGGIGIVRLSGITSEQILTNLFRGPGGKPRKRFESHKVSYGFVVDEAGGKIDEVMATLMRAPLTYTREDVVEISCHGGSAVLKKVLRRTLQLGARMAEPGEFSKRAFLNGRIDLLQAEAIIDLIRTKSEKGWTTAFSQLDGRLSHAIGELENRLVDILANVEASIDFPDEEIEIIGNEVLLQKIQILKQEVLDITETYHLGRVYREGVAVAIAGRPNVGKSSLLNALLQRERAIVTPQPGTTRDTIDETLHVDGIAIRLVDTAGVRDAADQAEAAGIDRTIQAIEDADIVLILFDGSESFGEEDERALAKIVVAEAGGKNIVPVINKSDLAQKMKEADLLDTVHAHSIMEDPIMLSAKTGEGVELIKKKINSMIDSMGEKLSDGPVLTRERHLEKFRRIEGSLNSALGAMEKELSREYIAADLQEAREALQELTGKVVEDSILEKIFSDFCIGK